MDRSPSIRVELVYSNHVSQSHSKPGSHVSQEQETRNLRLEIDHLRKRLQHRVHVRKDSTPPLSQSSESKRDRSYRQSSRTPLSESFTTFSHTGGGKDVVEEEIEIHPLQI